MAEVESLVSQGVQHHGIHGGHGHKESACEVFLIQQDRDHCFRGKGIQHDCMSAGDQRGVKSETQTVNVEKRERMAENIRGGDLPYLSHVSRIVEEIPLGQHSPFGFARGA